MQRYVQTEAELLGLIDSIHVDWRDDHFDSVERLLKGVPERKAYAREDIADLFDEDFEAAATSIRLILDLSKDSFTIAMKQEMGPGLAGKTGFGRDREGYLDALERLGTLRELNRLRKRSYSWKDILAERLKSGRGSAIRGQRRGKALEDFAEELIKKVFAENYESRCSFLGADSATEAKCDFAIPSARVPRIVIESKAYGATGSKQSDVLGDVEKIVRAKRHDTNFLFITDGNTWRERRSDLRRLIRLQNEGKIARIYTQAMRSELLQDLETLRAEHSL